MRTFQVPRYIQQAAKMSAQCRNTGFYLGHPYARWQETMAASTQIMLDPLTVATLEAEAEVRKGEREQARVEAELIDALRSSRR